MKDNEALQIIINMLEDPDYDYDNFDVQIGLLRTKEWYKSHVILKQFKSHLNALVIDNEW